MHQTFRAKRLDLEISYFLLTGSISQKKTVTALAIVNLEKGDNFPSQHGLTLAGIPGRCPGLTHQ
jgi:hypothetical protein